MSIITVLSSGSAPANITLNESVNNTTTITSLTGGISSIITIDQGLQGLPGPAGPPGTGILNINNYGDNRLLTSDGSLLGINAESNLVFDGSILLVSGIPVSMSGHYHTIDQIINLQNSLDNKQPSGSYSPLVHNHLSSDITNFNNSVSGLLPVKNILAGSGVSVISSSGNYTISSTMSGLTETQSSLGNSGRLTLVSGDPINNGNISGSTLYYCPYFGNYISLYNISNSSWELYSFNEISLSLSAMTINTNYDIFLYNNAGTLTLEKVAWTNNTTRAISLIYQDGILVRSGSINKRYIGTIRSTGTNTTEDSSSRRLVFNINNRIAKTLIASDSTTHTYIGSNIRPYRNITTLGLTRGDFVIGLSTNNDINLICNSVFATETNSSSVGVSIDSTSSVNTSAVNTTQISSGPALILYNTSSDYVSNISAGYHYIQTLQSGSSITTFYNSSFKATILC